MATGDSALFLLAIPSALALTLLARWQWSRLGPPRALGYFAALTAYGALRGPSIRAVTSQALDTPFPYLMNRPVAAVYGVSLQELLGWAVAVTLALSLAEPLVRRTGRAATPHRVSAVAALGLACVCLAVENAAIAAGWWTWTLALPASGPLRVPPVALLDWGFVAFDFLLPWLLASSPSGWGSRLAALSLFPLHMLGHTWVRALPGPLPVPGYDLVHVGIAAYVLWRAVGESADPGSGPGRAATWLPASAAGLVVGATAAACLASGRPLGALASLPLAALGVVAFFRSPTGPAVDAGRRRGGALRLALVAVAVVFLVAVSAPRARRQQRLVTGLERGVARLNAGDLAGAESTVRAALAARPEHAGGRTLLALVLLRQGRTPEARAELDQALAAEPTARDALLMAASLDLAAGARARADERATLGRRVYPRSPEFAYLSLLARGQAGAGRPPAAPAVALARQAGQPALSALAALAARYGDAATVLACREAGASPPRP